MVFVCRLQHLKLPFPVYAIDDQRAIKAVDGTTEAVSGEHWKLFKPDALSQ